MFPRNADIAGFPKVIFILRHKTFYIKLSVFKRFMWFIMLPLKSILFS